MLLASSARGALVMLRSEHAAAISAMITTLLVLNTAFIHPSVGTLSIEPNSYHGYD
jgi:hypothetical protein